MELVRKTSRITVTTAVLSLLAVNPTFAAGGGFCTATAEAQESSCGLEVRDDYFKARAICINVLDQDPREDCFEEATDDRRAGDRLCREQRVARRQLCAAIGEARYDPDFDPAKFDHDFTNLTSPNPYRPLGIGNHWQYVGGGETIDITVLDKTKRIAGVTCIEVLDRVVVDGQPVEDTLDWYGQRKNGTVDYCGEISRRFETFAGDDPQEAELVSIDGSWKAGRDGDLPGTHFQGTPTVGAVYRQEFSPGNAEDVARVLSTTYHYGSNPDLDTNVPQSLATLLCAAADCVVTGEFTPISPEPETFERKYYARGIGLFFVVHPTTGENIQLVDCNVDPRCGSLPTP